MLFKYSVNLFVGPLCSSEKDLKVRHFGDVWLNGCMPASAREGAAASASSSAGKLGSTGREGSAAGDVVVVGVGEEHNGGEGAEDPQRGRAAAPGEDQCSSGYAQEDDS